MLRVSNNNVLCIGRSSDLYGRNNGASFQLHGGGGELKCILILLSSTEGGGYRPVLKSSSGYQRNTHNVLVPLVDRCRYWDFHNIASYSFRFNGIVRRKFDPNLELDLSHGSCEHQNESVFFTHLAAIDTRMKHGRHRQLFWLRRLRSVCLQIKIPMAWDLCTTCSTTCYERHISTTELKITNAFVLSLCIQLRVPLISHEYSLISYTVLGDELPSRCSINQVYALNAHLTRPNYSI